MSLANIESIDIYLLYIIPFILIKYLKVITADKTSFGGQTFPSLADILVTNVKGKISDYFCYQINPEIE